MNRVVLPSIVISTTAAIVIRITTPASFRNGIRTSMEGLLTIGSTIHFTSSTFTMIVMSTLSPGQQGASHLVFDIDDTIWTVNVESAVLKEIADADSDYMRLDGSTTHPQRMAYGFYGTVSPGGSHIVYSTCEYSLPGSVGEYGYELGIASVDGTGKRRLTDNEQFEHYPAWSPVGTKIAFLRNSALHDYQDGAQLSIMTVDPTAASLTAAVGRNQSDFEAGIVTCPATGRVALSPPCLVS